MLYILDEEKQPRMVTQKEFEKWMRDKGNNSLRTVANERVNDLVICTSFLCLNYNDDKEGEPHFFECVIFRGADVIEFHRHSTWEQAEAGHSLMVREAREITI